MSSFGKIIMHPARMLHRESPIVSSKFSWPMHQLMHHHSSGPACYGFDGPFGHPIGMVSSNSTKGNGLLLEIKILHKLSSSKWMIIGVVTLDLDAIISCKVFELVLTLESFSNTK